MVVFVEPVRINRTFEAAIENLLEGIERARLDGRPLADGGAAGRPARSRSRLQPGAARLERSGLLRAGRQGGIFKGLMSSWWTRSRTTRMVGEDAVDVLRGRRSRELVTVMAAHAATDEDFAGIERTNEPLRRNIGDHPGDGRERHVPPRGDPRACHRRRCRARCETSRAKPAAIRDTYQGGQENDRETLEIHERQVEAMRRRDMTVLAAVLDEHFRTLEEDYAAARSTATGRTCSARWPSRYQAGRDARALLPRRLEEHRGRSDAWARATGFPNSATPRARSLRRGRRCRR